MKLKRIFAMLLVIVLMSGYAFPAFADAVFHGTVYFSSTKCKQYYYTTNWISKNTGESWNGLCCSVSIDEFSSNPYSISEVGAQAFYAKTSGAAMSGYRTIPSNGLYGYQMTMYSGAGSHNSMFMRITNLYSLEENFGSNNTINMKSSGCFWCHW